MSKTTLYPVVQFKKDTWEIDEFDCASVFLLVGSEKAMLIDTGTGIGDLKGAVELITDKPLIVVQTNGKMEHFSGSCQFDEVWINPKEEYDFDPPIEKRKEYIRLITIRQCDSIGQGMYSAYPLYGYDESDIIETGTSKPVIRDLTDGMEFDLGGGRIVKAYECPGDTKGAMMFLDEYSRSLFCGDALNFVMYLGAVPAEESIKYLKKMEELSDKYDDIYNAHHDFRAPGETLGADCLPNATALVQQIIDGRYRPVIVPSFMGPASGDPPHTMLCNERNFLDYPGLGDEIGDSED